MTNDSKYILVDTNAWISNLEELKQFDNLVVSGLSLRELDKLKSSPNNELAYRSRLATRYIKDNKDKFKFDPVDYDAETILGESYDNGYVDNRLVASCVINGYAIISNDLNVQFKAEAFGIEIVELTNSVDEQLEYTGIHKLFIDNSTEKQQELANIYQNLHQNTYNLLNNQYLVIYDENKPLEYDKNGNPTRFEVIDKFRFDGEKLVKVKIADKKTFKAKNEEQELAWDLLNNKDIPIKIIAGTYGSGKTYLAVKSALHNVLDKGNHAKILVLRNPIGSGEEIGFLKGTKEDKTADFFKPIEQQLDGGEQEAVLLETRGQLQKDIPFYVKGQTFTDTFVLVDEAEDLDIKQFKLVGSRIGQQSVMAFVGDVKQAEDKYKHNNGLLHAIDTLKGNPLVGIVVLSDDVRSEASKVFAEM